MKSLLLVVAVGFLGLASQSCCMFKDCGGTQVATSKKTLFGGGYFSGEKGASYIDEAPEVVNSSKSENLTGQKLLNNLKEATSSKDGHFGRDKSIKNYDSSRITAQTNGGKFIGLVPTMKKLAE